MAVSRDLRALMPEGAPYMGPQINGLLNGIGTEFDRLDKLIDGLPWEANPATTTEYISRWEAVVGIPEPGLSVQEMMEGRRSDVLIKLNATGGQSREYMQRILSSAGYDVEIANIETKPFVAGSSAGDLLTNDWQFAFFVLVRGVKPHLFAVGSDTVGSPLAVWDMTMMYRIIERIKPAHTIPVYIYEEE